jgi:hypothetical protein
MKDVSFTPLQLSQTSYELTEGNLCSVELFAVRGVKKQRGTVMALKL